MGGLRFSDAVVHTLRVSQQRRVGRIADRQLAPLELRRPQQAELKLESVCVEGGFAEHLGKAAFALAPHEVHLEKAEARVDVAGGEEQVMVGLRDNVCGAVRLEHHSDRLLQAREAQRAVGHLRVGRHRPRAGGGVEGRAESGQRAGGEEGCIQDGRGDDERRGEVEQWPATPPAPHDSGRTCRRRFDSSFLLGGRSFDGRIERHGGKSALTTPLLTLRRDRAARARPPRRGRRAWWCRPAAGFRRRPAAAGA